MAVHPSYGESFAKHAGMDAIDHEIGCANITLQRAQRTLDWLRNVKATRAEQIAAGTWPPKRAATESETTP